MAGPIPFTPIINGNEVTIQRLTDSGETGEETWGYNASINSGTYTISGNTVVWNDGTILQYNGIDVLPTDNIMDGAEYTTRSASSKLSVDLTTLSGWSNLSSGSHTIKIVAKGTGYRDSEKSAGVSVTKPSSGYADCLTFTGESSEFTLKASSKEWNGTLQWSTDHNTWTTLAGTEAMQSVGKKLYLRGKGNTNFKSFHGVRWELSAKAGCSGNIQTLLDWENPPTSIPSDDCYYSMFEDCANLTAAPDLPATTLTKYCYQYMFKNCVNLTTAPELPATTLAESCYDSMFWYCSRLQVVPELPATTLARYCYDNMFQGCNSLRISTTHGTKIFTAIQYSTAYAGMFELTGGELFEEGIVAGTTYYYYTQNATTVRQVPIVKSASGSENISALENMDATKIYTIFQSENVVAGYIYYKNGSWERTGGLQINETSAASVKFSLYFGYFVEWVNGAALECDIKATTYDYVNIGASVSNSLAYWSCFKQGTLITLANRTTKKVEDITYDDDLLVWNFYEGKFDSAKPMWIKKPEIASEYNLCEFDNGKELGLIGQGGSHGYHRIYNDEAKCFTHTGVEDTPIGTTTFAEDSTMPKLVSQKVVKEKVTFYNIITDKHYNLFANGILTSCRLSNKYKIENMRYVGDLLISEQEEREYFDRCEKIRRK